MRTPSTSIRSECASALSPSVATVPLIVTEPDSISSSQWRRLPNPARARIFWSRSSVAPSDGSSSVGMRSLRTEPPLRVGSYCAYGEDCVLSISGIKRVWKQTLLQRLHDLGARHELTEAGQVVEGSEPE